MPRLPRIPDILTTANLSCGVASILLASQGQLTLACWLVFVGAAFDVLDGLAARALGQGGSEFGKQLDSLADMVTFGVAPAFVLLFRMNWSFSGQDDPSALIPFLIPIASAWRLAKFNIDARQRSGFLGLPTPANALLWVSIVLASTGVAMVDGPAVASLYHALTFGGNFPLMVKVLVVVLCVLMLSELPLPSLKLKHMKWQGNEVVFLLISVGLVLVLLYGILAVPLILLLYLLSPLWGKLFPKTN